jgi:glucose dehydrogenase
MRALLMVVICSVTLAAQQGGPPTVTNQDILAGLQDDQVADILRKLFRPPASPLTQITPENVSQLKSVWTFQTRNTGNFQSTPLVIDGVLYVTGWGGTAWAIDARSGRQIWSYRRNLPDDIRVCCGPNNHGFGALGRDASRAHAGRDARLYYPRAGW